MATPERSDLAMPLMHSSAAVLFLQFGFLFVFLLGLVLGVLLSGDVKCYARERGGGTEYQIASVVFVFLFSTFPSLIVLNGQ
jgi:hypothetical protein